MPRSTRIVMALVMLALSMSYHPAPPQSTPGFALNTAFASPAAIAAWNNTAAYGFADYPAGSGVTFAQAWNGSLTPYTFAEAFALKKAAVGNILLVTPPWAGADELDIELENF